MFADVCDCSQISVYISEVLNILSRSIPLYINFVWGRFENFSLISMVIGKQIMASCNFDAYFTADAIGIALMVSLVCFFSCFSFFFKSIFVFAYV